jgi:hypothetical protein
MTAFEEYGEFLAGIVETIDGLAHLPGTSVHCTLGCAQCCVPLTLLPIEACSLLSGTNGWGEYPGAVEGRCPLLTPDLLCRAYPVRPLICRVRGFPVGYLDSEGNQSRDACSQNHFPGSLGDVRPIRLDFLNATLYRINVKFCRENGIPPRRISILDLYRSTDSWLRLSEELTAPVFELSASL